jgi:hypothetical protein
MKRYTLILMITALLGCTSRDMIEYAPSGQNDSTSVQVEEDIPDSVRSRRIDEIIQIGISFGGSEESIRKELTEVPTTPYVKITSVSCSATP